MESAWESRFIGLLYFRSVGTICPSIVDSTSRRCDWFALSVDQDLSDSPRNDIARKVTTIPWDLDCDWNRPSRRKQHPSKGWRCIRTSRLWLVARARISLLSRQGSQWPGRSDISQRIKTKNKFIKTWPFYIHTYVHVGMVYHRAIYH